LYKGVSEDLVEVEVIFEKKYLVLVDLFVSLVAAHLSDGILQPLACWMLRQVMEGEHFGMTPSKLRQNHN